MNTILSLLDVQGLCVASAVCQLWRKLSLSPKFWQEVAVRNRNISKEQIVKLCQRHPAILKLALEQTNAGVLDELFFRQMFRFSQRLVTLELSRETMRESCTQLLSEARLPALEALLLSSVSFGQGHFGDAEVAHAGLQRLEVRNCRLGRLALLCPQLQQLTLAGCALSGLRVQLPALQRLELSSCTKLSDSVVRAALVQLSALTSLALRSLTCVTDDTLQEAAAHMTELVELDVSGCTLVTLNGVRAFTQLRSLDMSGCPSFMDAPGALSACTALEQLSMDHCSALSALHLSSPSLTSLSVRGCQALQTLNLRCCSLVALDMYSGTRLPYTSCSALRTVKLASSALTALSWRSCPSLESVELECPSLQELEFVDCDKLGPAALEALSDTQAVALQGSSSPTYVSSTSGCPALASLRLESCDGLRSLSLRHTSLGQLAVSGCKMLESLELQCPQMRGLRLEECVALEVVALHPVGVASLQLGSCASLLSLNLTAPALTSLDLRGCAMLTQMELQCPQLQQLDTSFCSSLTDEALRRAVAPCPPLQRLVLSVCHLLGAPGLEHLAALSTLTLLDISYTTVEDLAPVYSSCPGLRALSASSCPHLLPDSLLPLLPSSSSPSPPALPHLRELDLSYCPIPAPTLTALLRGGMRLHSLALNGCAVTDASWQALLPPALLPQAPAALDPPPPAELHQLTSLSLVKCQELHTLCLGLAPATPIQVLSTRPYLNPSQMQPPPSESFSWIPAPGGVHALRSLRLGFSALQVVALNLRQLQHLDLSGCRHLRHLELRCPALHTVLLQGCRALPAASLLSALAACPSLEVLDLQRMEAGPLVARDLRGCCPGLRSLLTCPARCSCPACAIVQDADA